MIARSSDVNTASVAVAIKPLQEWTVRHFLKIFTQQKPDDSHPVLVRVGKRQFIGDYWALANWIFKISLISV
jgi:hypothetical protein